MHTLGTSLVRDAVHVLAGDALAALDLATGEVRWRVDLAALGLAGTRAVVPLGRRLFGVAPAGRLSCLRAG